MHYWIPEPDEISRNMSWYLATIFQKIFAVHYSFAVCAEHRVLSSPKTPTEPLIIGLTIAVRCEIIIYDIRSRSLINTKNLICR